MSAQCSLDYYPGRRNRQQWQVSAIQRKKIEIRPTISGQLAHARAEYNSPKGKIISAWKWEGEKVAVSITIPCNAEAVVTLPGREPEKLAFCC